MSRGHGNIQQAALKIVRSATSPIDTTTIATAAFNSNTVTPSQRASVCRALNSLCRSGFVAKVSVRGYNNSAHWTPNAKTPDTIKSPSAWLANALAAGPIDSQKLLEQARLAGHSKNALRRAKKELDVITQHRRSPDGKRIEGWNWTVPK